MKKILSLFLFLCISVSVFTQATYIISGQVIDAATRLPLQAASVFAQNTTVGTATGTEGNFKLELPVGGYDLVVTFTGYQTETKRITTADAANNHIVIELKQKEKELQDVIVKSTNEVKDGWEKYGDFFLENFIGKTENATQCTINNTAALKFYFYKKRNRLKVLATEPVEIVNKALGYSIKYTLDSFTHEYNSQQSLYSGYPLFEELQPADEAEKKKWDTARMTAYNGSILHFMRSLYHKRLKEDGFEIQFLVNFNDKENAITVKDFYGGMNYKKEDSSQVVDIVPNQKEVALIFINERPPLAYLEINPEASPKFQLSVLSFLKNEPVSIEQNGYYYDQDNITIKQYLGWEKVADMLPYDYILIK